MLPARERDGEVATPPAPIAPAAAIATDHSIAVLPFVNMSPDKEQEYFADGISEELLNLLAQVPELRVIARTSSFSFKGKEADIAEIARKLNVAHVLEGSVRKSGDTLRITAQLDPRLRQLAPVVADLRPPDDRRVQGAGRDRRRRGRRSSRSSCSECCAEARVTDPGPTRSSCRLARSCGSITPEAIEQAIALYKQALAIDPAMRLRGTGWPMPTTTGSISAWHRAREDAPAGPRSDREGVGERSRIRPGVCPRGLDRRGHRRGPRGGGATPGARAGAWIPPTST